MRFRWTICAILLMPPPRSGRDAEIDIDTIISFYYNLLRKISREIYLFSPPSDIEYNVQDCRFNH